MMDMEDNNEFSGLGESLDLELENADFPDGFEDGDDENLVEYLAQVIGGDIDLPDDGGEDGDHMLIELEDSVKTGLFNAFETGNDQATVLISENNVKNPLEVSNVKDTPQPSCSTTITPTPAKIKQEKYEESKPLKENTKISCGVKHSAKTVDPIKIKLEKNVDPIVIKLEKNDRTTASTSTGTKSDKKDSSASSKTVIKQEKLDKNETSDKKKTKPVENKTRPPKRELRLILERIDVEAYFKAKKKTPPEPPKEISKEIKKEKETVLDVSEHKAKKIEERERKDSTASIDKTATAGASAQLPHEPSKDTPIIPNTEIKKETQEGVTAFEAALRQINDELTSMPAKVKKEKDQKPTTDQLQLQPESPPPGPTPGLPKCFENVFSEPFLQNRKKHGLGICSVIVCDVLKLTDRVLHGKHKINTGEISFPAVRKIHLTKDSIRNVHSVELKKRLHYRKRLNKLLRKEKQRVGIKVNSKGHGHHHHHHQQQNQSKSSTDKKKERPPEKYSAGGTRILSFEKRHGHDSQIKRPKMKEPSPVRIMKSKKEERQSQKAKIESIQQQLPISSSFRIPKKSSGRNNINSSNNNSSGNKNNNNNAIINFHPTHRSSFPRAAGDNNFDRFQTKQKWHESFKQKLEQKMSSGAINLNSNNNNRRAFGTTGGNYYNRQAMLNDDPTCNVNFVNKFSSNNNNHNNGMMNDDENWDNGNDDDDDGNAGAGDDEDSDSIVPPPITKVSWDKNVAREVNKLLETSKDIPYPTDFKQTMSLAHKYAWWCKTIQKQPISIALPTSTPADSPTAIPELEDQVHIHYNDRRNSADDISFIGNVSDPDDVGVDTSDVNLTYENVDPNKTDEWIGQALIDAKAKYRIALGENGDLTTGEFKYILDVPRGLNYDKESFQATCGICNEFLPGKKQLGIHLRSTKHHEQLKNLSLKIKARNERNIKARMNRYNSFSGSNNNDLFDTSSLFDDSSAQDQPSSFGSQSLVQSQQGTTPTNQLSTTNNNDNNEILERVKQRMAERFKQSPRSTEAHAQSPFSPGMPKQPIASPGMPPQSPWSGGGMMSPYSPGGIQSGSGRQQKLNQSSFAHALKEAGGQSPYSPGKPLQESPSALSDVKSPVSRVSSAFMAEDIPFKLPFAGGSYLQPLLPPNNSQLYSSQVYSPPILIPPLPAENGAPPLPQDDLPPLPPPPEIPPPPPGDNLEARSMSVSDGYSDDDETPADKRPKVTVDDVKSTWAALIGQQHATPAVTTATETNLKSPKEDGEADDDDEEEQESDGFDVAEVINMLIELRDVMGEALITGLMEFHKQAEKLEAVKRKQSYKLLYNQDFVLLLIQARDQCINLISQNAVYESSTLQALNLANYSLNILLQTDVCGKVYKAAVNLGLVSDLSEEPGAGGQEQGHEFFNNGEEEERNRRKSRNRNRRQRSRSKKWNSTGGKGRGGSGSCGTLLTIKEKKLALRDLLTTNLMAMGRHVIGEGKFIEQYVTEAIRSVMANKPPKLGAELINSYTGEGFLRRHQRGTIPATSASYQWPPHHHHSFH